jgi:hypothetical protein
MGLVVCDLCGKTKGVGAGVRRGALALCEHCSGLFGDSRREADPGSLAAFAVATEVAEAAPPDASDASDCDRSTLAAPRDAVSERPTLPVPAPRLDELVKNLEGQFAAPVDEASSVEPASSPASLPAARALPRSARMDASAWGRGIMASAGITLAVMLAFLSSKATAPRAPGVPSALAREESPMIVEASIARAAAQTTPGRAGEVAPLPIPPSTTAVGILPPLPSELPRPKPTPTAKVKAKEADDVRSALPAPPVRARAKATPASPPSIEATEIGHVGSKAVIPEFGGRD